MLALVVAPPSCPLSAPCCLLPPNQKAGSPLTVGTRMRWTWSGGGHLHSTQAGFLKKGSGAQAHLRMAPVMYLMRVGVVLLRPHVLGLDFCLGVRG